MDQCLLPWPLNKRLPLTLLLGTGKAQAVEHAPCEGHGSALGDEDFGVVGSVIMLKATVVRPVALASPGERHLVAGIGFSDQVLRRRATGDVGPVAAQRFEDAVRRCPRPKPRPKEPPAPSLLPQRKLPVPREAGGIATGAWTGCIPIRACVRGTVRTATCFKAYSRNEDLARLHEVPAGVQPSAAKC